MAKAYLAERGIKYIEKDVSTDEEAREEMIKKSGQLGVPVIDVDGTVVIGFDKERLSTLIGK
jgi:glutaredoxin